MNDEIIRGWHPIETLETGKLVNLLIVSYSPGHIKFNALEDEMISRSIGERLDDGSISFAGWDWENDCFETGFGRPTHWAELLEIPSTLQENDNNQKTRRVE